MGTFRVRWIFLDTDHYNDGIFDGMIHMHTIIYRLFVLLEAYRSVGHYPNRTITVIQIRRSYKLLHNNRRSDQSSDVLDT
ncbi:hypothetical protein A0H81_05176 [Grifola frondosa]|uniref:Uncharacterized protein n=1 Tax=Grifola frondosa TaxID=5627 RepID=A0A1C7MDW3_GRIFR|nr:hypothetical protein A0H81_05176 [Grifola frondosa]